jgi:hypothetical protein
VSDSHHKRELPVDEVRLPAESIWARLPLIFAIVGVVGLVLAAVLRGDDAAGFYASYLVTLMFFATIGIGGLFFVLVHYATRAGWSVAVRRLAENAAFALPVVALLFIPLLVDGVGQLYEWSHFEDDLAAAEAHHGSSEAGEGTHGGVSPVEHSSEPRQVHEPGVDPQPGRGAQPGHGAEAERAGHDGHDAHDRSGMTAEEIRAHDPILAGKMPYLNKSFWRVRAVLYLAVWCLLAWYFRRRSVEQDRSGDLQTTRRLQVLSAPGIILFGLTVTFAAFDWLMSLAPHWFSTIFGVYVFAGCVVAIHAFLSLTALSLRRSGILRDVITAEHYHDLGKMLFAFTVFWTYIAFSQYMLIWYANLPEETLWYHHRWIDGWKPVSIVLAVGHFAVPFFFLMSRHIKRRPALLMAGAIWMLAIHYVDLFWLVKPSLHGQGPTFGVVDILLFLGMGGLFMAAFAWHLRRDALVPVKDPRLPESLAFENF